MNKIAFCLLTTKTNTEERFNQIRKDDIGIDFFMLLDTKGKNPKWSEKNNLIKFNGPPVWKKYNRISDNYVGNPQFIILEFAKAHPEYEYFWFCEDDIFMPNGDYKEFFEECGNIECDLLLTHSISTIRPWYWTSYIKCSRRDLYPINQYIQLFRLSKEGADLISSQFRQEDKAHSEAVIPSIIYMNGLTTKYIDLQTKYKFNISHRTLQDIEMNQKDTFYHPMKI